MKYAYTRKTLQTFTFIASLSALSHSAQAAQDPQADNPTIVSADGRLTRYPWPADFGKSPAPGFVAPVVLLKDYPYFYLRCGSNNWDLNEDSLFKPTAKAGVYQLELTRPYLGEAGDSDSCTFSATQVLNSYSPSYKEFALAATQSARPDAGPYALQFINAPHQVFSVVFPAAEVLRATLDLNKGTFELTSIVE